LIEAMVVGLKNANPEFLLKVEYCIDESVIIETDRQIYTIEVDQTCVE